MVEVIARKDMLNKLKALAFDTGGTILDWYSGVTSAFEEIGRKYQLSADWGAITNEYRLRSLQTMLDAVGPRFNIDDVHRSVLDAILREQKLDVFSAEDRNHIWRAWHQLRTWPDFPAALERFRSKYVVTSFTILSTSLVIDVSKVNGLNWDCVISCEMFGVYKLRPEAYRIAAKLLAFLPEQILMVACHNSDLVAAHREGYATAFVHRPGQWGPSGAPIPEPPPDPAVDMVVDTFEELAVKLRC